jgi:hypothetical protein
MEELQEVRGLCRGEDEPLCGMHGEVCCGRDFYLRDYGARCIKGLACNFAKKYAPAPPGAVSAEPVISDPTCEPCGAVGQIACQGDTPD